MFSLNSTTKLHDATNPQDLKIHFEGYENLGSHVSTSVSPRVNCDSRENDRCSSRMQNAVKEPAENTRIVIFVLIGSLLLALTLLNDVESFVIPSNGGCLFRKR